MAVIALDVGGTKIKAAIVTSKGKITQSLRVPTRASKGKNYVLKTMSTLISSLLDSAKRDITAIGISLPGFVDENGKVLFCGNALKSLVGTSLQKYFEKRFSLPMCIENDAHCFTLAEKLYGAGKKYNVLLGLVWGTGLGSSVVFTQGKKLESIASFHSSHRSMELGHIPLIDPWSNKPTTLERIVSGPHIIRQYHALGGKIHFPTVTDIFNSDEPFIKEFMTTIFDVLAKAIASAINILTPDVVIIGGGVSLIPDKAFTQIRRMVKKYALETHVKNVAIKRFEVSDDQGVLGAAYLAHKL